MTPLRQWMTEDMQLRGLAPATQQAYLRYAALQQLAQDPRFLGGQMGMLGVLQTWTRDLRDHPHVHYLVPALALAPDGTRWLVGKSAFLLHVKPLGERVEGEGPRGCAPDAMGGPGQRACLDQAMDRRLPTRRQWRECLNVSRPLDLPPCAEQQPPRGGRKWGGHVRYTEGKTGAQKNGPRCPSTPSSDGFVRTCCRKGCQGSRLRTAPPAQTTVAGGGAAYPGVGAGSAPTTACGRSTRTARGDAGAGCRSLPIVWTADAAGSDTATAATPPGANERR